MSNANTMATAKFWIEKQRASLGMPRLGRAEASLCEDNRFVMVYVDVVREHDSDHDMPIAASFDLGRTVSSEEFDTMREAIEQQFEVLHKTTMH